MSITGLKNFPFEHDGQEFWYSRSIVSCGYVFCYWYNTWHVLAVKRGATQTLPKQWNVPGGFLDHNETTQHAAKREVAEETGLLLAARDFHLFSVNSVPSGKRQHVLFIYYCNLGKVKELPYLDPSNCEPGEVEHVMWIPMESFKKFKWINAQWVNIEYVFDKYIQPNLWQRIRNCLSNQIDIVWGV